MVSALSRSLVFPATPLHHEGSVLAHGREIFSCEDCVLRIKNAVSKYFLEYIAFLSPNHLFDLVVFIGKSLYWELKESFSFFWFEDFKSRVQHVKTTVLCQSELQWGSEEFLASEHCFKLKNLFPIIEVWEKKQFDWLCLDEGTCFGKSFTAMKYHHLFDPHRGFLGEGEEPHLDTQVIFFQALHGLRKIYEGISKIKKRMDANKAAPLLSKEPAMREACLFYDLQRVNVPSGEARYLSEVFSELFYQTSEELELAIQICDDVLAAEFPSQQNVVQEVFSNEKECTKRTQKELDQDICDFLAEKDGAFVLIGGGERRIGHAMFLKMEQGKCIAYDPATAMSFVTDHVPDEMLKTVDLMKKLLLRPNLGGQVYYKVMSII